jgi:thioesterase domain-containing protein
MTPETFTQYLHREIPLTAAMNVRVLRSGAGEVEISAPLAPNRNLHGTAFAGSLATLGLISGWVVLDRALHDADLKAHLVAQKNECVFHAPATEELRAIARIPAEEWTRFLNALRSKGRARISVITEIKAGATLAVTHTGTYAAKQ